MTRLVLLCGDGPEAPVRWASGEDGGLSAAGGAPSLAGLAGRLPPHDELIAILPGERVATRKLRLPVADRQADGAARLALEDVLAEPVSAFLLGWTALREGERMVSAAPREWLSGWLAELQAEGLDPDVLCVDHAALHAEGHDGVVLRERGRVVARLPSGGLTASEAVAVPLVERLADGASLLSVRIGPSGAEIGSESLVLADERALGAFYLNSVNHSAPPNFRRGRLAKRKKLALQARGWGLAAGLMAACLTLWLAGNAVTGLRYHAAADRLRADAAARYEAAFPGSRIIDLRAQAERRAGASGGSRFLPLSAALVAALEETDQVSLSGLTYTETGQLVADVRYADFAQLERLSASLRARGLSAQEGQSPRRDEETGEFVDRLTVEGRS